MVVSAQDHPQNNKRFTLNRFPTFVDPGAFAGTLGSGCVSPSQPPGVYRCAAAAPNLVERERAPRLATEASAKCESPLQCSICLPVATTLVRYALIYNLHSGANFVG